MTFLHARRARVLSTALSIVALVPSVSAQTYQVLHSFTGTDGGFPNGDLVQDKSGNLYGTTETGGASGHGVIFKLSAGGTYSVMHAFAGGTDGINPEAGLTLDRSTGDLYGTASMGGAHDGGEIFRMTAAGAFSILYSFDPSTDGDQPGSTLTRNGAGNLYGTTSEGGPTGTGTVFKFAPDGTFTVIHAFGHFDGGDPGGRLARKGANLYGVAIQGGGGSGTLYKVKTDGTFTLLYTFTDGEGLFGGVARDDAGNIYGGYSCCGDGIVYKISPKGAKKTTLYAFPSGGANGFVPVGDMLLVSHDKLYGAASRGGVNENGTIYKVDLNGNFTLLHAFAGAPDDGTEPSGGLIKGAGGMLYGTTLIGGSLNKGIIFAVSTK